MDRESFCRKLKHQCVSGGARSYVKNTHNNNNTRSDSSNILSNNHHTRMLKSPWNFSTQEIHIEGSSIGGLSWPARSYTCNFCKREFRSAQALGGHMNVHRRDRARLRQSLPSPDGTHFLNLSPNPSHNPYPSPSPALNPYPNPNPNPNPKDAFTSTLSSHQMKYPLFPHPHSLHPSPPASSSVATEKNPMEVHKLGSAMNPPEGASLTRAIIAKSFPRAEEFDHRKRGEGSTLRMRSDIVRLDLEIGMVGDFKEDLDLELRLGTS